MTSSETAADPILEAELSRCGAILARDAAGLDRLLAEDFLYTHGSGRTEGKAAYIGGVTSGRVAYAGFERTGVTIRRYGDTAVMTGTIHMSFGAGDDRETLPYRFSSVWVEDAAGWRLVVWHNTAAPA